MKPRIFIGSSKEALNVAKFIQAKLVSDFECNVWTDDIFKVNKGTLETLLKEASFNDFGILVATKDDLLESKHNVYEAPRDNVILEFGLFLGRIGISRVFLVLEKDAKAPTDLLGITFPRFEITTDLNDSSTLIELIATIRKTMIDNHALHGLNLLPSTALAIGYFENFISISCDYLAKTKGIEINGRKYTDFEFNVVIPNEIDASINKRAALHFKNHTPFALEVSERPRPVHILVEEGSPTLKIYDMPTTLSTINTAISLYLKEGTIGNSEERGLLIKRELENFKNVLTVLINKDPYCRKFTKLITE